MEETVKGFACKVKEVTSDTRKSKGRKNSNLSTYYLPCHLLIAPFCVWVCEVMVGYWVGRKIGRNSEDHFTK